MGFRVLDGVAVQCRVVVIEGVEAGCESVVGRIFDPGGAAGGDALGYDGVSGIVDPVQVGIWSRVWSPPEVSCKQITSIIIIITSSIIPRPRRVLPEHLCCCQTTVVLTNQMDST